MPGIGLMKRRLEKESDAVALAVSAVSDRYNVEPHTLQTLETLFHRELGDWFVALGWLDRCVIVQMDSVLAQVTDIKDIPESGTFFIET